MSVAAEALRIPDRPKAEYRPLFENAPYGMAFCEGEGKITLCNQALERILSRRPTSLFSLASTDLLHPEDRCQLDRLICAVVDHRRDSFQIETEGVMTDAPAMRWTAWRVERTDGLDDGIVAMVEEVPSHNSAGEPLRQVHRLESIGRLAAGVAHDFNNVLTGVLLYCDLLMSAIDSGHQARKYADEIRKASLQASGIVRQLLAVAKPVNCEPRLLSLNEIAEGMRDLLARLIGENIQLKLRLDPALGLVKMDPSQVQQILLNLVLNSRDAMPRGGEITVETGNCEVQLLPHEESGARGKASLACVFLLVSDNGHGMDDATRARAFEPFFTNKGKTGNGLGLATVHDIVINSGGLTYVESSRGQGTRVSVVLPLAPMQSLDSLDAPDTGSEQLNSSQKGIMP